MNPTGFVRMALRERWGLVKLSKLTAGDKRTASGELQRSGYTRDSSKARVGLRTDGSYEIKGGRQETCQVQVHAVGTLSLPAFT